MPLPSPFIAFALKSSKSKFAKLFSCLTRTWPLANGCISSLTNSIANYVADSSSAFIQMQFFTGCKGKFSQKQRSLFYNKGGEPSRHSGPHCTHDIFSGPHLRFMRKEQKKVPQ